MLYHTRNLFGRNAVPVLSWLNLLTLNPQSTWEKIAETCSEFRISLKPNRQT